LKVIVESEPGDEKQRSAYGDNYREHPLVLDTVVTITDTLRQSVEGNEDYDIDQQDQCGQADRDEGKHRITGLLCNLPYLRGH